jgi:lipopolysaccharide biosynthesis regulator YciM
MPEKELQAIPRPLREQYEKGLAAIERQNLDYAITLLDAVLRQEPAFYRCREALRVAQFKRAGKKRGFLKQMFGAASHSAQFAKGQYELRTNPREALATAEQILNADPHSLAAHRLLADAALAVDLPKTAVLSLEIVFKDAPDRDTALKLGRALGLAGQVERAESVLTDLATAFPKDMTIAQALKDFSAKRTMSEGYDSVQAGASFRDLLKDKEGAIALEQEQRGIKDQDATTSLLAEYQERLKKEPNNIRLLRSIAELHTQRHEFDTALEYYQRIAAGEGVAEPGLERAITQTTLRRYDQQLARLDPDAPDADEQKNKLQSERQEYELTRARLLADKYSSDLQLRFELGLLYFKNARWSDAIQEFQKAQASPHKRIQALNYLGQCFTRRGLHDLAVRAFQTAIREKETFDEEKKELIYELGEVLEKAAKPQEAIEQFKLIYEVDIGYRDVAAKIDAFYSQK